MCSWHEHNHNLRLKWRRGRGSQKGVGGAEVPGRTGPHQYTTIVNNATPIVHGEPCLEIRFNGNMRVTLHPIMTVASISNTVTSKCDLICK